MVFKMWKLRLTTLCPLPDVTWLIVEEPEPQPCLTWSPCSFPRQWAGPEGPGPEWEEAHLELRPQQEALVLGWLSPG